MYWFPEATVTHYHTPGGVEPQGRVLSQSAGRAPSGGTAGESESVPGLSQLLVGLPTASGGCLQLLVSLACGCISLISICMWPPSLGLSLPPLLSFTRALVIECRAHPNPGSHLKILTLITSADLLHMNSF